MPPICFFAVLRHMWYDFTNGLRVCCSKPIRPLPPQSAALADVIYAVQTAGMELFSDIVTQQLLCR
ncbi:hypothetical protein PV433_23405 [Paenibacillus sp. GYB004]|uniref:hypothetical protein n=1 Tax=Paenibacillus sp. GYB004 TaxID=2994393 RepID=UPI002F963352